jgi:hypothetical protein
LHSGLSYRRPEIADIIYSDAHPPRISHINYVLFIGYIGQAMCDYIDYLWPRNYFNCACHIDYLWPRNYFNCARHIDYF